jgi:3-phenylpropionate/trans-cinnamate dioxygenase ferredoxin reductase component
VSHLNYDLVISGAGHGGGMAAVNLRQAGFTGSILMVGEEPDAPYERPPLSKAYLTGKMIAERLILRKPEYWTERNIDLRLGVSVTEVDAAGKTVRTSDGDVIGYENLVWAAGGRVRKLSCAGHDLAGVYYVRTKADTDALRAALHPGCKLVVIGGGYIGLETAASARQLGCDVTLVEAFERVLIRVTCPQVSAFYEAFHRAEGVDIRTSAQVEALTGEGKVSGVKLAGGEIIPADAVVVGIGIVPNIEPLALAGLKTGNGICIDELCQTSDPSIFALGDCTDHPNAYAENRVRLESVQNALDQAKTIAGVITGTSKPYADLPWFWSDQYNLKMQTAGLALNYDSTVMRGDPASNSFSIVYLRGGQIIAIDAINAIKDFMAAKSLIINKVTPDPVRLADSSISLKEFA